MPNDKVIISQSILNDIANAIKAKTGMGEQEKIKPINMANTISSISGEAHLPITVNITQSGHQTITVTPVNINNVSATGTSIPVPYSVTLNATIVAEEGYIVGTLNQSSVTANWGDTVTFSATPATLITFDFTLPATTNQTITLSYTEPGESLVTRTSTSTTQVINMKYGTTWNATVIGDSGYEPGTLSISSGTINGNISITVTEATVKIYEVDCSVMISGVAQNYPAGEVNNNNYYNAIGNYFKTNPGNYLKSDWLSMRGYSNIENDKYSSYTNLNYSPNQFLIYYQEDAIFDLGDKESLTVDGLNSDGYYDSSTGYIHVKNNKYNPIIIRQLFGVEVQYINPTIAQSIPSIQIYNYDFNNRILSLNSDPDNPDGTIMLLLANGNTYYVNPSETYIMNHIYIPPDDWTNNHIIERYLFNFTYEDTVTEAVYSNTSGKKNTDITYANLSDGPVYDIEMFGFRVFHVEDNESYQDYYDQLSRVAYDNNLSSTYFISYNQNNPKLHPNIVQENFRMLIYKQLVDQMYPYVDNSDPQNNPLLNTPINFKLIFK